MLSELNVFCMSTVHLYTFSLLYYKFRIVPVTLFSKVIRIDQLDKTLTLNLAL